ncbi:sugar ABC transporter substrate-binding protein [Actinomadura bangladeshensis]|uniref:Sugar ABC transporter substrate-binding protein n=1 Tax=Actinomadura bangladeshensis TaxID=453573 RepID=A0A4R4P9R4_9ACTN|nr:sugar ABC transporter substrate-binding protein [Actinomadura bangladeshensis]TDC19281.1 sugar ABC transporter substrate-binding protein [Actinomadura bangladeshensis]
MTTRSSRRGPDRSWRDPLVWGVWASAMLLVLTACSGGSLDTASGAGSGSDVLTDAMKPVTKVAAPTEKFTQPKDKHILILSCGSSGQGCVNEAKEEERVAKSLGWTVDVVDGKLDPTVWNQVVKQAAQSGVDGIIAISSDPNLYGDAMEIVADKDIPFVLTQQTPGDKDVKGIDTYIAPDPQVGGHDVAKWIIADSGGRANVLVIDFPGFANVNQRGAKIIEKLESDCEDCTVTKVDQAPATIGTGLAPLVTNQLQQNPGIDYIWGSDDCCVSFMQQGIQQAGRTGSVKLASMTGYPEQMTQIKDGTMGAELASPTLFSAWLAVDSLGRLMAGEPTQKYWALPQRIWTKSTIDKAPPEIFKVGWNTEVDYQKMFEDLWGTSTS